MKYVFSFQLIFFVVFNSTSQDALLDSLSLEKAESFASIDSALKNPDKVIKLVLRKDKLTAFPEEIFQFKNLQYLDLSRNKLIEIPKGISTLKNLQKLVISKNKLTSLPKEIGELENLRELNASENNIEYIPAEIGKLDNLLYIDFWSNNINKIPAEIKNLKKLKVLDLRVVLFTDAEQEEIQNLLPNTMIYFSPACKCKQ